MDSDAREKPNWLYKSQLDCEYMRGKENFKKLMRLVDKDMDLDSEHQYALATVNEFLNDKISERAQKWSTKTQNMQEAQRNVSEAVAKGVLQAVEWIRQEPRRHC